MIARPKVIPLDTKRIRQQAEQAARRSLAEVTVRNLRKLGYDSIAAAVEDAERYAES